MFIQRHIAPVLEATSKTFPVVIVSGPRQVGKTTLLQKQNPDAEYVTFDRLDVLRSAEESPEQFLESLMHPAIIDEVQYCPDLFRYIKINIDSNKPGKGYLFLTGSQRFQMMQGVDESLAGRAGIVAMLGLSLREVLDDPFREPFIPTDNFFKRRSSKPLDGDVWESIWRGDLPELVADSEMDVAIYYQSYIETYLRRDVRDLAHVGDLTKFNRFLSVLALRHGQILNKSSLASECEVSLPTVERWLSVLEASSIIYFLRPFTASSKKRLVKSPKLYFLNSGLVASLLGLATAAEAASSEMAGALFEGYVVAEVAKSFLNASGRLPELYFYRDSNGKEIDLVIPDGKKLHPVEIKKAEIARPTDAKSFAALDAFAGYERSTGAVICMMGNRGSVNSRPLPLAEDVWAVPVTAI